MDTSKDNHLITSPYNSLKPTNIYIIDSDQIDSDECIFKIKVKGDIEAFKKNMDDLNSHINK